DIESRLNDRQNTIATEILKEIRARIGFLLDVGLSYLTLDRASKTLSGGEAQRIRLATQIGSQLVNVLYILDEPSIGLHQRDNESRLNDRQNTIATEILKEIRARIGFLLDVGLSYLTLDRASKTLSGGEAQRIRLATQIGSQLVNVLYILDEPSIGLHQRDNE